jgi:hypothetical protein
VEWVHAPWTGAGFGSRETTERGATVGSPERSLYDATGHVTSQWIEENRESNGVELTEGFTGRRQRYEGGSKFLLWTAR